MAVLASFSASVLLVLAVLYRRQIPLISPYGIFIAFQCLYNLLPWAFRGLPGLDLDAVDEQLIIATVANVVFAIIIATGYRRYDFLPVLPATKRSRRRYIIACLPLFVTTAILCHFFGWHIFAVPGSVVATGGMASVTAYFKHFCVATFLYYLIRYGIDRYAILLLSGLAVITAIDGARTDLFPVLVIFLMFWQGHKATSQWKLITFFGIGVVLLVVIRGLLIGTSGIDLVFRPIVAEGILGASSSIQSIFAVQHMAQPPYLFGFGSLDSWIAGIDPWIIGDFAPLGGFYYVADGVANFGYFGPILETAAFAWILCKSEKWRQTRPLIYLAFMSSFGLLFTKVHLVNGIKLFLAELAFLTILSFISRFSDVIARESRYTLSRCVPE